MEKDVTARTRAKRADYTRELHVNAPAARLFDAIATRDGIQGWWTRLVRGSSEPGGTLRLEFDGMDEHIDLRVVTSVPVRAGGAAHGTVQWTVVEHSSLEEWAGTRIRFDVAPAGEGACTLAFRHVGLSPALECYDQCEAGWDHFLDSLVAFAERGRGTPFGRGRGRR